MVKLIFASITFSLMLTGGALAVASPASAHCGHPGYPACPVETPRPQPTDLPAPTVAPAPTTRPTPPSAPVPAAALALQVAPASTGARTNDRYCHLDEFGYGERFTTDLGKMLSQPGNVQMPITGICVQANEPAPVATVAPTSSPAAPATPVPTPEPEATPVAEPPVVIIIVPCWTVDDLGNIVYFEDGTPLPCGVDLPTPEPTPEAPALPQDTFVQLPRR